MRTVSRHRIAVCALAMLVASALAGCAAEQAPAPSPTAAATDAPVFASDEEALAAATKAYAAYQEMSDLITADGGADPTRIQSLASRAYAPELLAGFDSFAEGGRSSRGKSKYDTVSLVSYTDESKGRAEVDVYLCSDVSGVRLLDESGQDTTPVSRPNRIPLKVALISSEQDPSTLLINREDVWSGVNFC